jgi:hypothetical protein
VIHREFIELLRGIEAEFPVTSWKIRGIHVWPLIRLSLKYSTFPSGAPVIGWRRLAGSAGVGLAAWSRAYVGDWRANRRPWERADAVFLTNSLGRRPMLDGKRYDIRSGPFVALLEQLGARALVWEMSPYGDYNIPRHTPSFLAQPHLIGLRAACRTLPLGDDQVELTGYDEFLARVREAGLKFPLAEVGRIRRDALYLRRLADRFAGWLRRSRPRLCFVANTGLREQAFCLACRELGITSVEVQHGIQGELHPSYGSWFAVPKEGWETRARVFWSWDEASAAAINRWAVCAPDHHVAIVGGDPWREIWLHDSTDAGRPLGRLIEERKQASGKQRHILVTLSSQGDIVPQPLLEAIGSSPASWCYWFRLHPVNQARRRAEAARVLGPLGADLGLMDFATEVPLHALLWRMDCHLTATLSTVVAEAAALGLLSVACSPEAADFYHEEMAAGLMAVATTGAEIQQALHWALAGRRPVSFEPPKAPAAMRLLLAGELPTPQSGHPARPA